MSDYIHFMGKFADIRSSSERKSRFEKEEVAVYDFTFGCLNDLTILLNMSPEGVLMVGDEWIPYSRFREEYLNHARRIYINRERELMDMVEKSDISTLAEFIKR